MISAKWDVTSTCNLRCAHCSVAGMYFNAGAPAALSLAERLHVLDNLADGGVTYLSLLGGEPLTLGDDLFCLLRRARDRGVGVSVVTNGQLLDAERAARLIDCGLSNLAVSIDGPQASIHDQIRGKRTFYRLLANVERFQKLRGKAEFPRLTVNTVLCRPNRQSFAQMIPFCREIGADHWNALTLNYLGSAKQHIDDLAVSVEEHAQVALEIGRTLQSASPEARPLAINMTLVYPLVWEVLCRKHGVPLPQPQICCSAASSLVYVSATGELHLCDRVNSSGYTGSPLDTEVMRPVSLLKHQFADVWRSPQFCEMFDFVKRARTYANFEPCNRCKYLFDRTCNPCPLQSYQQGPIRFEDCLQAEAELGDISRYDDGPRTVWERLHQFTPLRPLAKTADDYERISSGFPVPTEGVRWAEQDGGEMLLMHPSTLEFLKVNEMGWHVWTSMTGEVSIDQVVSLACDVFADVGRRLGMGLGAEHQEAFARDFVRPFILSLHEKGFISIRTRPTRVNPAVGAAVTPIPVPVEIVQKTERSSI